MLQYVLSIQINMLIITTSWAFILKILICFVVYINHITATSMTSNMITSFCRCRCY